MHSRCLTTYEVRLMEWKGATSLGDFPGFSNGMVVATHQMRAQGASEKDELNMDSNSWWAKRPGDLRNEGRVLPGPAAQHMVCWYVSWIVDLMGSWHAESADPGVFIYEFAVFGFYVSDASPFVRHWYRTTVQTLDDIPRILAVWIRQCILKEIFPTFCLDLVDSLRTPWQVLIHSCLFWHIVHRRQFRVWIFSRRCGVIQGLDILLSFVFLT